MSTPLPAEARKAAPSMPKQAGEGAGHAEKPGSVSSEGDSCSSEPRAVIPSLFPKRSQSVFLCEISQYLNTRQAKQNTAASSPFLYNREYQLVPSADMSVGRNLELSVRLCAPPKAAHPFRTLRYSLTDSQRLTAAL